MKSVRQFLNEEWKKNSGHITKKAILDVACDRLGSYMTYADIEGSYMAVYYYWDHNVEWFDEFENDKWVGYIVRVDIERSQWLLNNYGQDDVRLIVPTWVMDMKVNDEAKNLLENI